MTGTSPNNVITDVATHSANVCTKDRKRKATSEVKDKYANVDDTSAARKSYNRRDGGTSPEEVVDDLFHDMRLCCENKQRTNMLNASIEMPSGGDYNWQN